jgi:protein-S-isoprenylcysteine O-methyltransferase Ste14
MIVEQGGIVAALWLAWVLIWAIAARGTKPAMQRESVRQRLRYVVLLAVAGFLLAVPFGRPAWQARWLFGWLGARFLPPGWASFAAGVALLAAGLGFAVWARVHLGANWSSSVEIKRDHALIESGPYRLARHPIYTGLIAAFLGTALARGEWHDLLAVPFAVAGFWLKAQREEQWMLEAFGPRYAAYQERVAALIPFVL